MLPDSPYFTININTNYAVMLRSFEGGLTATISPRYTATYFYSSPAFYLYRLGLMLCNLRDWGNGTKMRLNEVSFEFSTSLNV
jgi:hypothetical protein